MRISLVDLLFSWPPNGGADVDLYNVATGLTQAGHDVQVVVVNDPNSWERGAIHSGHFSFSLLGVHGGGRNFHRKRLPERIREAVDMWNPEVVFLGDGFLMKPYVGLALADYPLVSRYYAYEMTCLRDAFHFKDGAPCPNHYLITPGICRACALDHLGPEIRSGRHHAWTQEYLTAQAYDPGYRKVVESFLGGISCAIVSNERMKAQLEHYCPAVHVVPGGVESQRFTFEPLPVRSPKDTKRILMTGRATDPLKGLDVLLEAGERLYQQRRDFMIHATVPEETPLPPFALAIGWQSHQSLVGYYHQADVCVVPSRWEEPFGLVALEAMAAGRPVCASRVGGLQDIVVHKETGFLFESGDAAELAKQLDVLLDNASLRQRMGIAAHRRVYAEYRWPHIVSTHYLPILKAAAARSKGARVS